MAQNPNSSARSQLTRIPENAKSSAVRTAWKRAAPGSVRPMTWCQPIAAIMQISIASKATTVRWSTWSTSSTPNVWKLVGPLNATDMLKYWYVATNGVDLLVRTHVTRSVSKRVTTVPNIAIAEADLRVRMLERASRKDANGAMSSSGTAHPRVVDGSNVKPALVPDAAPDAAARISASRAIRVSESPPGRRRRDPGRRARRRRWPATPRTPGLPGADLPRR